MHIPSTPWMNVLYVQMICIADICDCVDTDTVMYR